MAETKSLKTEILEKLHPQKVGLKTPSRNMKKPAVRSATRSASAQPKAGAKAIYEGKNVVIQSINETGMAVVRFGNNREVIVRSSSLKPAAKQQLDEGFIGMASILPTYKDPTNYGFAKIDLDPEDIGLIFEADDDESEESEDEDGQEEDKDNGSNVRSDGHTGKLEVDELPTPSDTISPAYSDEIAPKEISEPLSIHAGAQEEHLWDPPEWDGYDYPADAPEIPSPDFLGSENGNSRPPHWTNDQEPGKNQENRDDDGDEDDHDKVEEATAFDRGGHEHADWKEPVSNDWRRKEERRRAAKQKRAAQDANLSGNDVTEGDVTDSARDEGKGHEELRSMRADREFMGERQMWDDDKDEPKQKPKWQKQGRAQARQQKEKQKTGWMDESFNFMAEMDAMLGGSDTEPKDGDTITLTLPAMASVVCTVANKVGQDKNLMKAIVEALAEVSKGKTIDIDDLEAVAAHINGEEMPEMMNREDGEEDHAGMEDHESHEAEPWPGDGDPTGAGKTKLMGGIGESITEGRIGSTLKAIKQSGMRASHDRDSGEFRVNHPHNREETAYYTNDPDDAIGTAKHMRGLMTEKADYFGGDDVMVLTQMTEDEEIALLRARAFPNRIQR